MSQTKEYFSDLVEQPDGSVNIDINELLASHPDIDEALKLMDEKDCIFIVEERPSDNPEESEFVINLSENPAYRKAIEKVRREKKSK